MTGSGDPRNVAPVKPDNCDITSRCLLPAIRCSGYSTAGSASAASSVSSVNASDSEFRQWRCPVGGGPSSNTWPRWASHRAQRISVRSMPKLLSTWVATFSSAIGWKNDGQPVPELNLAFDENSGNAQQRQL